LHVRAHAALTQCRCCACPEHSVAATGAGDAGAAWGAGRALQQGVQPVRVVQAADAAGAVAGEQHLTARIQAQLAQQPPRGRRRDALAAELPAARAAGACARHGNGECSSRRAAAAAMRLPRNCQPPAPPAPARVMALVSAV